MNKDLLLQISIASNQIFVYVIYTGIDLILIYFVICTVNYVQGKIVSLPRVKYILDGDQGSLRCQNRSEDELVFYNYIWDANWYRLLPNKSILQYEESGPIHVISYALFFDPPLRPENEGEYYCCQPNGPCSGSSNVARAGMTMCDGALIMMMFYIA